MLEWIYKVEENGMAISGTRLARMYNSGLPHFNVGDAVEFDGRPKRGVKPVLTGVVKDGPKGKHFYYEVSTASGQFKVPAKLLRKGELAKKAAEALQETGQKFDDRRVSNREKRNEAAVKDCQISMDIHKFTRGMLVINRGVPGWPKVTVLDVDYAKGKVLVESSTKRLGELASLYGVSLRRNTRDSKWVYANRLVPA
jgi:hypothetical protein